MASVLVPLAPGCEEIEAVTLIDLLRRGGIEVVSAGLDAGPIRASRGVTLIPDATLDEALQRDYDMVALPGGGPGAERLDHDPRIEALLKKMSAAGRFTAAICAAPKVFARIGLLDGRRATSFPGFVDKMDLPSVTYLQEAVVQDGTVITSRGPGTAMDFALHLVELLAGADKRREVEDGLQRN